jgi:hypothetical protein
MEPDHWLLNQVPVPPECHRVPVAVSLADTVPVPPHPYKRGTGTEAGIGAGPNLATRF